MNAIPLTIDDDHHPGAGATQDQLTSDSTVFRLLRAFEPHGLEDLSNASLMNRVDRKFVLPHSVLPALLEQMTPHYSALQIADNRSFTYVNCYYDTADYLHYHKHHNRRLNRFKFRHRLYEDSGSAYFEVKLKNNRNRTEKSRTQWPAVHPPSGFCATQTAEQLCGMKLPHLNPVQKGQYHRISLANEAMGERLTIDMNLQYSDLQTNSELDLKHWIVVELKQAVFNRQSPFFSWSRHHGFRPCSFSKYCMGLYYTGPGNLRRNHFHRIHRQLEKIHSIDAAYSR